MSFAVPECKDRLARKVDSMAETVELSQEKTSGSPVITPRLNESQTRLTLLELLYLPINYIKEHRRIPTQAVRLRALYETKSGLSKIDSCVNCLTAELAKYGSVNQILSAEK